MAKRIKTTYPGIFFYEQPRVGGSGIEKVYYALFKSDGKLREERCGGQFRDAMTPAKAARIRAERIDGKRESRKTIRELEATQKAAIENRPTISRLWELYKEARPELKGIVTDQNRFQKHLDPTFGKKTPDEIDPLSIDRFRVKLGKTHAPATVANALELMRRLVNFGVNSGLCATPRAKIRLPRVNNLTTESLNQEQLQLLMKALDEADNTSVACIMKMALFTGMRKGEILKLQWSDLDFDRGFLTLRDPKGGQEQRIPMSPQARTLLESLPRESEHVFPGRNGGQRVELRRAARKIADAAGLPKSFRAMHGLRHAFASILASSGEVDMYTLQRLLTHKSPLMTQRYAHLADEALQRASAVAGTLVQQAQDSGSAVKVVNLENFRK